MTPIEEEIIADKQLQVDLVESGVIRASSLLICEAADAAEANRLTLEKIRSLYSKLGVSLKGYDRAFKDLNDSRCYYEEKDAADGKKDKEAMADDNHE